jgi:hypothetical protein
MAGLAEELKGSCLNILRARGFVEFSSTYHPTTFGDSSVGFANGSFRVRFVRDRGRVYADVASLSAPNSWQSLVEVLGAVETPRATLTQNLRHDDLCSLVRALDDNYETIAEHFSGVELRGAQRADP